MPTITTHKDDGVETPADDNSIYVVLSRIALWLTSSVLLGVIVVTAFIAVRGDLSVIGNLISAAQALTFIAVTVLGYHGYRGMAMGRFKQLSHKFRNQTRE